MVIFSILAMLMENNHLLSKFIVIREDSTAITIATKWLRWEEAGTAYGAKSARFSSFILWSV